MITDIIKGIIDLAGAVQTQAKFVKANKQTFKALAAALAPTARRSGSSLFYPYSRVFCRVIHALK